MLPLLPFFAPNTEPPASETTTSTTTAAPTETNEFCDTSRWNIIRGDWDYNAADCCLTINSGVGNTVWFGSADGLIPDANYDDDIFTVQSTVEFLSSGGEANIMFRTGKSSATDIFEGPTYRYGLNTWTNEVQLFINDGENSDTLKRVSVPSGLTVNTKYTISVHGEGDVYNFYLDGDLMIGPMTLSDLKCTGSVGIWTYGSAATFCSFEYTASSGTKDRNSFLEKSPLLNLFMALLTCF